MGEEVDTSGGDGEDEVEDLAAALANISRADRQGFKSLVQVLVLVVFNCTI